MTEKRMAILMKETKIKTSLLSLTLESGNKILVCSTFFLLSEKTTTTTQNNSKQQLKTKDVRDLITTSTLMTAVTNTRSFQCRETKHAYKDFHSRKRLFNSFTWLFFGCSLVGEDFNNFRLCGSAASHANTKLSATKYMA